MARPVLSLVYEPPGPVSAAFMDSDARVRAILGPVGSGKTSVCCWDILMKGMRQRPSPIDGVRYFRALIIRDHFTTALQTVIPSWKTWFPEKVGKWKQGPPCEHTLFFKHPSGDGTMCHIEVVFGGLGEQSVEEMLRGREITMAYINEADLLPEDLMIQLRRRLGRYPSKTHGGASWRGMVLDYNAPDVESWVYRRFEEKDYPGHELFKQPSGRSPQAENIENLPEDYYEEQIAEAEADPENTDLEWWVKRFVDAEYVFSREGKPVFRHFRDSFHVARRGAKPRLVPGVKVSVGTDGGRTPAAIFGQRLPSGRLVIHSEIVLENSDATDLGEAINDEIGREYRGFDLEGWGDPAAAKPTETSNDDFLKIVSNVTKFKHKAAPGGNRINLRHGAINHLLKRAVDGQPGLVIGRAPILRRAFNSGYRYTKYFVGGKALYREKPEKNDYSHPMDAAMNLALGTGGDREAYGRGRKTSSSQEHLRKGAIMTDTL